MDNFRKEENLLYLNNINKADQNEWFFKYNELKEKYEKLIIKHEKTVSDFTKKVNSLEVFVSNEKQNSWIKEIELSHASKIELIRLKTELNEKEILLSKIREELKNKNLEFAGYLHELSELKKMF